MEDRAPYIVVLTPEQIERKKCPIRLCVPPPDSYTCPNCGRVVYRGPRRDHVPVNVFQVDRRRGTDL